MSGPTLEYDVRDGVATLLMNRPEKRNALSSELVGALADALERSAADEDVRVVVLRGAGKDFCSGADLAELEKIADMGPEASLEDAAVMGDLFVTMRRHPRPILAAVQGRALAGGCGLATACDLILAHEDAELGYPEVHLGFVPAMVMAILRRKVTESVAFDLVTSGRRVGAEEAHRLGLVNRVFADGDFEEGVERHARELARIPASALELSKRLLYGLDDAGFDEGIARGAEVNAIARLTDACREGVRRFLERQKDS